MMVKVAVFAPPATVTLGGTMAEGSLLERETTSPPTGAGLANVTVPVEVSPLTTETGVSDRLDTETPFGPVPMA